MAAQLGQCFYFGTFNPLHSGHLMIAQSALSQYGPGLGFERVTFVPAGNPPHRHHESDLLDAVLRLKMVELATASHPGFSVTDFELTLPGKTYTVETLRLMEQRGLIRFPVPFIIGSDALSKLHTWHQPEALVEMVHFLQAPRPDCDWVDSLQTDKGPIALNTSRIEMPVLGISSTAIREALGESKTSEGLRYYLPEPVRRFIDWNALYRPR